MGAIWEPILVIEPSSLEQAAHHEAGHAVARWALNSPFLRITLNGPNGPITEPQPGRLITSLQDALIATCGFIADYQHRGLKIRGSQVVKLLLGGADDRFEVDDASTGAVAVRPLRTPAVADGGDLRWLANAAAAQQWPAARCLALWRDSERFAASCRPAIDAVAVAVLKRDELSYAEVSEIATTAMAGQPAPLASGIQREWRIRPRPMAAWL